MQISGYAFSFLGSSLEILWNFDFATWFFYLPYRVIKSENCKPIFLIAKRGEILFTWLPCCDEDYGTASPSWSKRSQPMSSLRPSATTVKAAAVVCRPLPVSGIGVLSLICIGLLENICNCGFIDFAYPYCIWVTVDYSQCKCHNQNITRSSGVNK